MNAKKHQLCALLDRFACNRSNHHSHLVLEPEAITWAVQTRLGSCLIDFCDEEMFDANATSGLKAEALTAKFWFQTQYQSTLELIAALNKQNIVPTIIKGMSVSTEFYPKAYYRSMRDIDILLEEHEIKIAEKIMIQLGYKRSTPMPLAFYETHHHTIPWQHKKNDIWFEIHRKLFPSNSPSYSAEVFQLKTINAEKRLSSVNKKDSALQSYRFGNELQIVYIAAHWAESLKQVGGLFAFIDIALIINHSQLDWKKLITYSNAPYVANYVYLILSYLIKNKLVNADVVKPYLKQIPSSLNFIDMLILNSIISSYLFAGKKYSRLLSVDNISILWELFIGTKPSFFKLLLVPVYILFPPHSENKYDLRFQLTRIKNLLFKSSS